MDEAKNKTNQAVTPGPALTRREWLLSLGSAVVLSGFRGVPEEAAKEAHASLILPPGLYRPWNAHLLNLLDHKLAYVASTRAEPLYYLQTISTGRVAGPPDPQLELHADTFHPSLKAWLFLTDVTDDEGPLTYVAGSHLLTRERLAWEQARSVAVKHSDRLSQRGSLRVAPEELPGLGLPPPRRFAVPANTLVVVDTYGFHARGSSSEPTVRAEIWAFTRRTPFVPWTGFDFLSWRPVAARRTQWLAAIVDRPQAGKGRRRRVEPGQIEIRAETQRQCDACLALRRDDELPVIRRELVHAPRRRCSRGR